MNERRGSLFLERQSYRRRRLVDVIRILPLIGALLWLVPLLWQTGAGGMASSDAIIYIFLVWFGLVVLGAVLSRLLARGHVGQEGGAGDETR